MPKVRNIKLLIAGITLSFGLILCGSCGRDNQQRQLTDIESVLDSRPDSALVLIRQIDTTALWGRSAKARFALLHAAALDKNYIDTADTRIAQPAVDWYDRHGSPEERLKAYMYLGTEQYNAGRYNQAIVSFNQAKEQAEMVDDQNLLGILYSKMAETYTRTFEYYGAGRLIDKSIACFRKANRKDQEILANRLKAQNLTRIGEWEKADSCFRVLVSDITLPVNVQGIIHKNYAMEILYNPSRRDFEALVQFDSAINRFGTHLEPESLCAYAYVTDLAGFPERSDSLFKIAESYGDASRYNVYYWKHRMFIYRNEHKLAYEYLWKAKNTADSIMRIGASLSAANSQNEYLERRNQIRTTAIVHQRRVIAASSLFGLLLLAVMILFHFSNRRLRIEERGRKELVIDSLNDQIRLMRGEIDDMTREYAKARFSYMAKLYEKVYTLGNKGVSGEIIYKIVNDEIESLKMNIDAQDDFERLLNIESNGIMERFRNSFTNLSDNEYRLASLIFAGFDNTTIMLIMGISTLEHTRVKKSRLRQKIENSAIIEKEVFLNYFNVRAGTVKRNNQN